MNWLAHLFLAQPNVESRLGNLLGDLVKGKERDNLHLCFQPGLRCHLIIDSFTDRHIIVKRSKQRIDSEYRRFAGILVDVFYDHFLATHWDKYSSVPLDEFTATVYCSFQGYLDTLPLYARRVITRMIAEDWLSSYRHLSGVENTLLRISWKLTRRTNKKCDLAPAIWELKHHYAELEQDFANFFPELIVHIDSWYLASTASLK